MSDIDSSDYRRVLGHFPTGVVVITALGQDGGPVGLAIGSFTSVSLDPPLVAFLPATSSTSWPQMSGAGTFTVNVLSRHQEATGRLFSRGGVDRFAGIDWTPSPAGNPVLPEVSAWIDCSVERIDELGDHWFVLGRVTALAAAPDVEGPLVFYRGSFGHFRLAAEQPDR